MCLYSDSGVDDDIASRHGVFFSRREAQENLAFVRQKPSPAELRELSQDFFYLMDSGIVLMNAKATMKLMEKSGWVEDQEGYPDGTPVFMTCIAICLRHLVQNRDPQIHCWPIWM